MITALPNRADIFFVRTNERGYCPICGTALLMRGWRARNMIENSGAKVKLKIRRLKCGKCKRIHHELPDCIVPYKRHSAETIENIISGSSENVPCENRTIRRIVYWWKTVLPYFLSILKSLAEKYELKFDEPPLFKEIIQAAVNTNNWIFAESVCTRTVLLSG